MVLFVESEDGRIGQASWVSAHLSSHMKGCQGLTGVNFDIDLLLTRSEKDRLVSVFCVRYFR